MEIHLKIKDVVGMDDQKRHILRVDVEEVKRILQERKLWNELLDDPALRNSIYLQEKARRESSADHRERRRLFEIDKRRRQEQHHASVIYRKNVDFIHDILGWNEE